MISIIRLASLFLLLVSHVSFADGSATLSILNGALEGYRQGQKTSSEMNAEIEKRNIEVSRINQEMARQKSYNSAMEAARGRLKSAYESMEKVRREKSIAPTYIQPDLEKCLSKTNKIEAKFFRKDWADAQDAFSSRFNSFQIQYQQLIDDFDSLERRLIDTASSRSSQDTNDKYQDLAIAQIHAINLKIIHIEAAAKYRQLLSCLAYLPPYQDRWELESNAKVLQDSFFSMELDFDYQAIREILAAKSQF